jgi:flavin reductase (DIM6/NTAB) family NADH-FMN oxidoreductase RutF
VSNDSKPTDHIDPVAYRGLMRFQAGAVTLITVGRAPNRTGLTATAVVSLTDTPPTLLVCVNRNASGHAPITAERSFAVNILAADQEALAMRFSGKAGLEGEDRFDSEHWTTLVTGAPILKGALASLDCEVVEEHGYPTHSVFVGRVKAGLTRDGGEPMIYYQGKFRVLG